MSRIGVFSGTFDPVHSAHIALALEAIRSADLDQVYFAPEATPRRKHGFSHIAHRVAMIKLATAAHPKLKLLELPDKQFSAAKTLPRLKRKFAHDELFYICGSDMMEHMPEWPLIESLLSQMGLVIGVRGAHDEARVVELLAKLPSYSSVKIITSPQPDISGGLIREAVRKQQKPVGLLASTADYVDKHWLYVVPKHED